MDRSDLRIGAIVLAAGMSTRMGANKLLAPLAGRPVVRHIVDTACARFGNEVIVVTGHDRDRIAAALDGCTVRMVHAAHFAAGMAHSIKAGLSAVPDEWDAVLICLGDMPLAGRDLIDALCTVAGIDRIVVPRSADTLANPVLWGRDFFDRLATIDGDAGGKALIRQCQQAVVLVDWDDPDVFRDADTTTALREIDTIFAKRATG